MIKLERFEVMNMNNAIRGARNPMNSWARMDSYFDEKGKFVFGPNDLDLARRFEGEGCDSCDDDVIQIESIPQFCDTQIEVKSQMTVSAPAVTPEARAHSSCKETSEDAVSVVPYKPKEKKPYPKKEYSVIRLKGLQISFDASLEGMDITRTPRK